MLKYSAILKLSKQQSLTVPFGDAWARNTGDPQYFYRFKDHINKHRKAYQQIFTPESIERFQKHFQYDTPVTVRKGVPDSYMRYFVAEGDKPKHYVQLQNTNNRSVNEILAENAVKSVFSTPKTLPKLSPINSYSNHPDMIRHLDYYAKQQQLPEIGEGHQFTHYALHTVPRRSFIFWKELRKGDPNALQIPYSPRWQGVRSKEKLEKKIIDHYITDRTQSIQAQQAINRGRNLIKNTLKAYPFAYPNLDYSTRQYLINMPTHWQTPEQADQFFNKVLWNPSLFQALPLEAKRGIGNRFKVQQLQRTEPITKKDLQKAEQRRSFFNPSEYLKKLKQSQLYDWYKKLRLLTSNSSPNKSLAVV